MTKMQFPGQFQDETVRVFFRRHPIVMRHGLWAILIGTLGGGFVGMFLSRDVANTTTLFRTFFLPIAIGILLGGVALSYYWIGWFYSICIVTDQRFIQINQKGIFKQRSVNDITLNKILSVNYQVKGMMEALLGFGTIIIQTMAGDFFLEKVGKPADRQEAIVQAIKESGIELSGETT